MIMIFTKKLVYVRTAEKIRRCQTVFSVMIVPRKEENDTETAKKRKKQATKLCRNGRKKEYVRNAVTGLRHQEEQNVGYAFLKTQKRRGLKEIRT